MPLVSRRQTFLGAASIKVRWVLGKCPLGTLGLGCRHYMKKSQTTTGSTEPTKEEAQTRWDTSTTLKTSYRLDILRIQAYRPTKLIHLDLIGFP